MAAGTFFQGQEASRWNQNAAALRQCGTGVSRQVTRGGKVGLKERQGALLEFGTQAKVETT